MQNNQRDHQMAADAADNREDPIVRDQRQVAATAIHANNNRVAISACPDILFGQREVDRSVRVENSSGANNIGNDNSSNFNCVIL